MKRIKYAFTLLLFFSFNIVLAQEINGELKRWHKISIDFRSDEMFENGSENPFLDYRLNVTFQNEDQTYVVPGFFAADGNAANTGADSGTVWRVHFVPDEVGKWSYKVSFRNGKAIATNEDAIAGRAVGFDATTGSFTVTESDKTGADFRAKGRLNYTGERYLQFARSKEYFIKGGAGSPENLLGYFEFDQTPASHKYAPHAQDWKQGDPTWQNGKGKNIIGAMNYLASKGMRSVYFLTMNVQGDGNDVWPWNNINERYRFDCSKLDQWEVLFDHMNSLGLMLHIMTQETENELLLDIGQTKVQRKLYYRELIARFAHHLGVTWNLGEENGPVSWSPKGQDDDDRKAAAKYIRQTDPYKNHIALHTHAHEADQAAILEPMLGYEHLTGASLQIHHPHNTNKITSYWVAVSRQSGQQWVVPLDEIGPAGIGAKPDKDNPQHNAMRSDVLWGNLMAGGAGVEWYFGYKFAHNDLNSEDWRSRDLLWNQTNFALEFFEKHLPFSKMKSANDLTGNPDDFVFAQNGKVYAIYLPEIKETQLDLSGFDNSYTVRWYNPRVGGALQKGTIKTVRGGSKTAIGTPPDEKGDWVALLTAKKAFEQEKPINMNNGLVLEGSTDFRISPSGALSEYYQDTKNGALAIDASNKAFRNTYATAYTLFKGKSGHYELSLETMAENDGESTYLIKINGSVINSVVNPETGVSMRRVHHNLGTYFLETNDLVHIASMAVTNGRIPEKGETAWSRGRWNKLILQPAGLSMKEALENATPIEEINGYIEVEAEAFHHNSTNGTPRKWHILPKNEPSTATFKKLTDHSKDASNAQYIEALPDTRVTNTDKLTKGENFFPEAGTGGIVSYKIDFSTPGTYRVWARAYSTGSEDNGVHIGIDGQWPESGARIQWCEGKNRWTWSAAQRTEAQPCGVPNGIYLTIDTAGEHIISFSMREDGFEMDKWIMTTDENFVPKN